jgi:prephenate dehydrogenase
MIVDVLSVKVHAKRTMLDVLPQDADILCTHPMFGPESGKAGWQSLPFLYDKVCKVVVLLS